MTPQQSAYIRVGCGVPLGLAPTSNGEQISALANDDRSAAEERARHHALQKAGIQQRRYRTVN